jgi:hypothetical protein
VIRQQVSEPEVDRVFGSLRTFPAADPLIDVPIGSDVDSVNLRNCSPNNRHGLD